MAIHAEVKHADLVMLATEVRDLLPETASLVWLDHQLPPPIERHLLPDKSWETAQAAFIDYARRCNAAGGLPMLPGLLS
jgi:hypothetical protein